MNLHAVIYRYADRTGRLDEHRPRAQGLPALAVRAGRIVISGPLTDGAPEPC